MESTKFITKAKRVSIFLGAAFLLLSTVQTQAKNRTLSNGFSMHIMLGSTSSEFGNPDNNVDGLEYGMLNGFQIGNRWYFSPADTWGIGLMVNWFDFSGASGDSDFAAADAALFELGPIGTYAINESMAIDGYYNLRPTFLVMASTEGDLMGYGGFGITHALGVAYRWKVLSVGVETVFGSVNSVYVDEDDFHDDVQAKLKNNSTRFVLGVKF